MRNTRSISRFLAMSTMLAISGVALAGPPQTDWSKSQNRSVTQLQMERDKDSEAKQLARDIAGLQELDIGVVVSVSDEYGWIYIVPDTNVHLLHFSPTGKFSSVTHCSVPAKRELVVVKMTRTDVIARDMSMQASPSVACSHVLVSKEKFVAFKRAREEKTRRQSAKLAERLRILDRLKEARAVWGVGGR